MILRESGVFDGGGERSKVRLKLAMWQNYLYNLGSTRGEVAAFQDAQCVCKLPAFIALQPSKERERGIHNVSRYLINFRIPFSK